VACTVSVVPENFVYIHFHQSPFVRLNVRYSGMFAVSDVISGLGVVKSPLTVIVTFLFVLKSNCVCAFENRAPLDALYIIFPVK